MSDVDDGDVDALVKSLIKDVSSNGITDHFRGKGTKNFRAHYMEMWDQVRIDLHLRVPDSPCIALQPRLEATHYLWDFCADHAGVSKCGCAVRWLPARQGCPPHHRPQLVSMIIIHLAS